MSRENTAIPAFGVSAEGISFYYPLHTNLRDGSGYESIITSGKYPLSVGAVAICIS